jgi:hypothetical protein
MLQGTDNVQLSDSLPLGMLSVNDSIPNGVLEEDLEHATSLIMDEAGNALDTAMLGQMTNSRFGSSPE